MILVLLYLRASSAVLFLFLCIPHVWITPVSQTHTSRKRYANRKVMKNNKRKSDRIYPTRKRNPNARSFWKKSSENMSGMSLRSIDKNMKSKKDD
jgi:hypothetical protein